MDSVDGGGKYGDGGGGECSDSSVTEEQFVV